MQKFGAILVDPPWQQPLGGNRKRPGRSRGLQKSLPYPTMPLDEICQLPVGAHAENGCHLWLWTTNAFLEAGFSVLRSWGFRYLAPIHWIKPSGIGNYVVHRSQTLLLGYKDRCIFDRLRYFANLIETRTNPARHSQKPNAVYELIEKVSPGARLELFARRQREGWTSWGNELESDFQLGVS